MTTHHSQSESSIVSNLSDLVRNHEISPKIFHPFKEQSCYNSSAKNQEKQCPEISNVIRGVKKVKKMLESYNSQNNPSISKWYGQSIHLSFLQNTCKNDENSSKQDKGIEKYFSRGVFLLYNLSNSISWLKMMIQ